MALLAGCASKPNIYGAQQARAVAALPSNERAAPPRQEEGRPSSYRTRVTETALSMLGAPYRYGGTTPSGFDCSGLVHYAYDRAGLRVPRTTTQQFAAAENVHWRDAQPGDLLFFKTTRKVSHVGIYLGDGRFVHAPSTGRTVEMESLESRYYRESLVRAGRFEL